MGFRVSSRRVLYQEALYEGQDRGKKGQWGDKKRTVVENNGRIPGINFILNIYECVLGKDAEVFPGLDTSPFLLPSLAKFFFLKKMS